MKTIIQKIKNHIQSLSYNDNNVVNYRPTNKPVVNDIRHSYFSNGILSHNTTTVSAFMSWYICFHNDRNVFICANKERTAVEIMGKVKEVLEGLPYFMKPGIISLAEKRIKFENGCSIKCAAASKSPATGDSI